MKRRFAVGVVPFFHKNGNDYLILGLDRQNGYWNLPSGGLEEKDGKGVNKYLEGARREYKEEFCNMSDLDENIKYPELKFFHKKSSACKLFVANISDVFDIGDFCIQQAKYKELKDFDSYNEFSKLGLFKLDQNINLQKNYFAKGRVDKKNQQHLHKRVTAVFNTYHEDPSVFRNAPYAKVDYEW